MDKKYSVQEVFEMIGEEYLNKNNDADQHKHDIEVDGFKVHPISLRYMTFYQKGTKCVCCGKDGTYFQLDGDESTNRRHFNLYADDGTLITKDHIIPKSKGGVDRVSNMQTMCAPCNKAKGAFYPGLEREYIIGTKPNGKEVCFATIEKAAYHIAMQDCKLDAKKISKVEAVKGAITCVLRLQAAIENQTPYARCLWRREMK
jgi:5-methylcytosine-specific restriction endonuclease McrA